MIRRNIFSRKLISAILIVVLCLLSADARAMGKYRILVFHSFHQEHPSVRALHAGLESVLNKSGMDIEVITEFMDARRHAGLEYDRLLTSFLQYKYANKQFDAIVTSGNFAYRYLSEHRQGWFGSTPWVFCGVRDQGYATREDDRVRSTGLTEKLDIAATIEIALRLHPDRNLLYAIIDNNRRKDAIIKITQAEVMKLKPKPEIRFLEGPSLAEFSELLKTMPSNALILFLPFARDNEGISFSFKDVHAVLRQYGHVPAYTLWEESIGDGIVGGKVTNAESQGRGAAEMALRIIRGEKPEEIPVVRGKSHRYMFNYNELKRFGVPLSALPEGSVVLNRPPSFYRVNKWVIWASLGGIVFLSLIILFLLFNLNLRRRAEEALSVSNARLAEEYEQRKRLSRGLIDLLEQDRRSIAMELHDHIGQILTTMRLSLAACKNGSTAGEEEFKRFSGNAEEKLDQVMKGVRETVQGLRPMALELQGLTSALQSLMTDMEEASGLKIFFFCGDLPERIDVRKELALFRIVQEALNNVIKHAGARNVHVNLIHRDNALSLSIEDDGGGFDSDRLLNGAGAIRSLGLVLMRERALQVDGEFQINSRIGRGTHILVEVPIQ